MGRMALFLAIVLLLLSASLHLGWNAASAQGPTDPIAATFTQSFTVVTAGGKVFTSTGGGNLGPWVLTSNVGSPAGDPVVATFSQSFTVVTASGKVFTSAGGGNLGPWALTSNVGVPVGDRVVGTFSQSFTVVTANGSVYTSTGGGNLGPWVLTSFVGGSPVPANQTSWGQLKARYRN